MPIIYLAYICICRRYFWNHHKKYRRTRRIGPTEVPFGFNESTWNKDDHEPTSRRRRLSATFGSTKALESSSQQETKPGLPTWIFWKVVLYPNAVQKGERKYTTLNNNRLQYLDQYNWRKGHDHIYIAQSEEAILRGCHYCNKEIYGGVFRRNCQECNGERTSPAFMPVSYLR
jgi:hypothetical protein